jgi:hypothetical protein
MKLLRNTQEPPNVSMVWAYISSFPCFDVFDVRMHKAKNTTDRSGLSVSAGLISQNT